MLRVALCFPIPVAVAAMEPLQVQTIIDDITLPHEGVLAGAPDTYWAEHPRIGMGNDPGDWTAMTAWGQIYREEGKGVPPNTRIQIRDFEAYQLKKSDNAWHKLQDSDESGIGGGAYAEDFADNLNKEPNVRDEGNRSLSVKLEIGYNYHFWPNGRASIDPDDIGAMLCVYEARLILDDPNGVDDRDDARYLAACGGDYWASLEAQWDYWKTNSDFIIARHKFVTNEWQYFTACTYQPIENIRDNPPPNTSDALNVPPSITFALPSPDTSFTEPVDLSVVVAAHDSDGTIDNVKLHVNDRFVRQENVDPYEWGPVNEYGESDTALYGMAAGTYTVRAEATDNRGATAEATMEVTVDKPDITGITTPLSRPTTPGTETRVYSLDGRLLEKPRSISFHGSVHPRGHNAAGVYLVVTDDNIGRSLGTLPK